MLLKIRYIENPILRKESIERIEEVENIAYYLCEHKFHTLTELKWITILSSVKTLL